MLSSSAIVGFVLLAAVVSAEFGYYIPKAFYKIDENGYKSPLTYIDNLPPLFHRTRRSAQLGGVNFGFPIQFPSFPQIPAAGTGSFQGVQTTVTSSGTGGGNLDNRFDEGGQTVHTTFTSFNNNNGHFSQTTHFFDKDGKVTTHKHESGPGSQSNSHPQSDSPASPSSSPSATSPSSSSSSSSPNQKKN